MHLKILQCLILLHVKLVPFIDVNSDKVKNDGIHVVEFNTRISLFYH
jgi:hypothetical protein